MNFNTSYFENFYFFTNNLTKENEKNLSKFKNIAIIYNQNSTSSNPKELRKIMKFCKKNKIKLIEDNAHGLFAQADGRALGTSSAISTLSFHETKNIQCGEGGMLVINNVKYVDRAEILWEKGTNRAAFFELFTSKTPAKNMG